MPRKHRMQVMAVYVKTSAVRCDICREMLVVAPGKKPEKILANHIKRKHPR